MARSKYAPHLRILNEPEVKKPAAEAPVIAKFVPKGPTVAKPAGQEDTAEDASDNETSVTWYDCVESNGTDTKLD